MIDISENLTGCRFWDVLSIYQIKFWPDLHYVCVNDVKRVSTFYTIFAQNVKGLNGLEKDAMDVNYILLRQVIYTPVYEKLVLNEWNYLHPNMDQSALNAFCNITNLIIGVK